jgi:ribosomal peptide maturation radical SAM protein 1
VLRQGSGDMCNQQSVSVLLIVPPFFTYGEQSIGTAAIKSALNQKGITSKILYANAQYAKIIGVDNYRAIMSVLSLEGYKEQIFARSAHGIELAPVVSDNETDNFYTRYWKMFTNTKIVLTNQEFTHAESKVDEFIDQFIVEVIAIKPKIIGFSSIFYQVNASLAMAGRLKCVLPETIVVIGGTNCNGAMGEELARMECFDYVFDGEADVAFPDFCSKVLSGTKLPAEKIVKCLPVQDLDKLDIPDYSDFASQFTLEERKDKPLYFESSRGCWWGAKSHCKFCGMDERNLSFRTKSARKAGLQLCQMRKMYPENKSFFGCDLLFPDSFFEDFFETLSVNDFDGRITYQIKPILNYDQLRKMKEGGVETILAGIESLSTKHLRLMSKGTTAARSIALLRNCKELNLAVKWSNLIAIPEDSGEDYQRLASLFPLIQHFDPPYVQPIIIHRFSPYFENHQKYGITNLRPIEGNMKAFPKAVNLMNLAYAFNGEFNSEVRKAPELLTEFVIAVLKWYVKAGANPAELVVRRSGGKIFVKDTRDCAVDETAEIEEYEDNILKRCRVPQRRETIKDNTMNLLRRGYLLDVDDRLVSIVCETQTQQSSKSRLDLES